MVNGIAVAAMAKIGFPAFSRRYETNILLYKETSRGYKWIHICCLPLLRLQFCRPSRPTPYVITHQLINAIRMSAKQASKVPS